MDLTHPTGTAVAPDPLPGIDVAAIESWWGANVRADAGPLQYHLIAGGRSNLTYRVRDAHGRDAVLRRPPAGAVLQTAHDVVREARIVGALAGSGVPVPEVLGVCESPDVTGAPFYVMDLVDGVVLHDEATMRGTFAEADRGHVAESIVDGLVRLHALDIDESGLGDLGRREGYVERQLRRWDRQWRASRLREVPLVDEVHDRLAARIPAQQRASIVHGDYRLGNVVVGPAGDLRAVLDWELCTLGDPLADLGYTLAWWVTADDAQAHPVGSGPTSAPGVPDRRQVLDRYAARTGFDVSDIGFHVALAYWKTACIMEGVRERDLRMRPEEAPPLEQVPELAERALAALEGEL
ncbi:phosphotransferase family protein [Patulibacter minatonensis]|uniref:phosphotransferase family protein n=1 Tax=Patulibacter minatonensis TaxID=298163 RepID=UPI000684C3A5|nr:phosphotransferase family protein [Patulibacter minatonensis]